MHCRHRIDFELKLNFKITRYTTVHKGIHAVCSWYRRGPFSNR
jgi:hypothetical protein